MVTNQQPFEEKRLFRVAQELNVSTDRVEEYLRDNGYEDSLSGMGLTAKISSQEAYLAAKKEFGDQRVHPPEEGETVTAIVRNLHPDHGAFVRVGTFGGRIRMDELAWKYIDDPSEVLEKGDRVECTVLHQKKIDGQQKLELSRKQLLPPPWEKHQEGSIVKGTVNNITEYGAFVDLDSGVTGLIHKSEISWTDVVKDPKKRFETGEIIEVRVINVDEENERIGLSTRKVVHEQGFEVSDLPAIDTHHEGEVVHVDFADGLIIKVSPGVFGHLPTDELYWDRILNTPSDIGFSRGDEIDVSVLDLGRNSLSITLSHKRTKSDTWSKYASQFTEGSIHDAEVDTVTDTEVNASEASDSNSDAAPAPAFGSDNRTQESSSDASSGGGEITPKPPASRSEESETTSEPARSERMPAAESDKAKSGELSPGPAPSQSADNEAFITTWKTTDFNEEIFIPTGAHTGFGFTVDWGDGTVEEVSGTPTHTYAKPGTYAVAIYGPFKQIYLGTRGDKANARKLQTIEQWGKIEWASMHEAFAGAQNMSCNASDTPDLSKVTEMRFMFCEATSFNGDIGSWDVSNVTDMSCMFAQARSFNQDISDWDVSSVAYMFGMFENATSFNQDISDWDVSNVTYMTGMFSHAESFNQDISDWDVSSVAYMSSMFENATSFNQDISDWDVSNVTDMENMFRGAKSFNPEYAPSGSQSTQSQSSRKTSSQNQSSSRSSAPSASGSHSSSDAPVSSSGSSVPQSTESEGSSSAEGFLTGVALFIMFIIFLTGC